MKNIIFPLLACAILLSGRAFAEQGGSGHYVSGQFADFSGTVPAQSGWVFANYFLNYNDGKFGGSKELPLGGVLALSVTANYSAEVPVVMYAYPLDFLGGTLASSVAIPFQWVRVKAGATFDNQHNQISAGKQQSTSGLGDIQLIPVMAGWTNGDFKYDFFLNIWAPTGDYNKSKLANTGLGYWTFTPMVAVNWLSTKIGTEVSVFSGVDFNTENTEANYTSGNIFHVDATVAQHLPLFGGVAGAGATAFWIRQISNDSGSGARLGGFQAESYGVGPTVSYVHKVGKSDLVVDASWLPQLHADNTTKGDYVWVKLTLVC